MNKDEIYSKAVAIVMKQNEHRKHMEVCQKAGLCPKCGDSIHTSERYCGFFGFITDYSCNKCGAIDYL
jgi:hypothetical protein